MAEIQTKEFRIRSLRLIIARFIRTVGFADPLTYLAASILIILIVVGLLAPLNIFGDPRAIAVGPRLAAPDPRWWFGTDQLGRSLLPRVLQGIGPTFLLSVFSVFLTSLLGVPLGMLSAYWGGLFDQVITRVADVLSAFPSILVGILLIAVLGAGVQGVILSIVLIIFPLMLRVVRAATLRVKGQDFVISALVGGASTRRIIMVHILTNISGPVIVQATFAISVGMLVESSLSFLGLGVQPPDASLGSLVHAGILYIQTAPWTVFIPGIVLALAIFSVNLLGDGLRDALDPRPKASLP